MIKIRPANTRGGRNYGWLDTRHTFSFSDYFDPAYMGFGTLRVINEDRVQPGQGFGRHGHRDMEIISYVLDGSLEHKDSLGTGSIIKAGEIQKMSAGTGILHSDFNPSTSEVVHFYQIWILPAVNGLPPVYQQAAVAPLLQPQGWTLVAGLPEREAAITVYQDVAVHLAKPVAGESLAYQLAPERQAWLQVLRGQIQLADQVLQAGDGAAIMDTPQVLLQAATNAEVMLFDLA
jgi:redox-sensitive bicupin YhaK (pirin superfamily)